MTNQTQLRNHPGYIAFVVHRISGLCLGLFLPAHLYVISLLLNNQQKLDGFLDWTTAPWVKLSETLLIMLAAAHLAGGIRILIIEWFAVAYDHTHLILAVSIFSIAIGLAFLIAVSL